jgi:hypothetical protein
MAGSLQPCRKMTKEVLEQPGRARRGRLPRPGGATQSDSSLCSLASLPGAALSAGHFVHTLLLMAADHSAVSAGRKNCAAGLCADCKAAEVCRLAKRPALAQRNGSQCQPVAVLNAEGAVVDAAVLDEPRRGAHYGAKKAPPIRPEAFDDAEQQPDPLTIRRAARHTATVNSGVEVPTRKSAKVKVIGAIRPGQWSDTAVPRCPRCCRWPRLGKPYPQC